MSENGNYRRNHFVPQWYQRSFLTGGKGKLFYLDLGPEIRVTSKGYAFQRNALKQWGPPNCFVQKDLYTTRFGPLYSTEIERRFFGDIDAKGEKAVKHFASFRHPEYDHDTFQALVPYLSVQKLRTPKGLLAFQKLSKVSDRNSLLIAIQQYQNMFCAVWSECVWQLADASKSETKFIISDHPVTVYNRKCSPLSVWCQGHDDPDIRCIGSQTLFPLSSERILIMTNLSMVRLPNANPLHLRPNPNFLRPAMFAFQGIQTERHLAETEVREINFIIKQRAFRFIAAAQEEWLYPEGLIPSQSWPQLGGGDLLMPDPRSVTFSSGIVIGYEKGGSEAYDAYGRRPFQRGYSDRPDEEEWDGFQLAKALFAKKHGPKRRGRSFEFDRLDPEEDSPDTHERHLALLDESKKDS